MEIFTGNVFGVQIVNNQNLKNKNMKVSNAALVLFAGFTAGFVTGILIAPDEGKMTRKKLQKKAKKYKKNLEDTVSGYKEKASDLKENIEGAVKDVKKRFS